VAVAGRQAMRAARPWLAVYARAGYMAKGAVYLIVGALALAAAVGAGGKVTDVAGALLAMYRQPLGSVALVLIGVGLVGFASLRVAQAVLDPENRPRNLRMALVRIGEGFTGIGHALLALGAFRLAAMGRAVPTGDRSTRDLSRDLLVLPYGDAVLVALGLIIAGVGLWTFVRALVTRNICRDLVLDDFRPTVCRALSLVVRFGLIVQGALMLSVGMFMVRAALTGEPGQARGPAGVIRHWTEIPHGELLLGVFALGLLAVAASCFFDAMWRRFPR
jgi:hypothetical protein